MSSFYYTFGSDPGFPYQNGWVEVKAASRAEAHQKFRARFPDQPGHEGIMNYSYCYSQKQWTKMDPERNWPGWRLCETIE